MKRVKLITLTGRKGQEIIGDGKPLTSFAVFKAAAVSNPAQASRAEVTTVIWRKLGKALDAIEDAEEKSSAWVDLEDDWYDIILPAAMKIILNFGIHSPMIEDALKASVTDIKAVGVVS